MTGPPPSKVPDLRDVPLAVITVDDALQRVIRVSSTVAPGAKFGSAI
jgi:hypothetical protein